MSGGGDGIVLLVEDDPGEVLLTQMAFQRVSIAQRLVAVGDGREALDWLFGSGQYSGRDLSQKPRLILLDLKLPLVSGLDVLKAIRSNESTCLIPVTVLTSSAEPNDQREAWRLGATEYICKPTSFSDFLQIVRQLRSRWLEPAGPNDPSP